MKPTGCRNVLVIKNKAECGDIPSNGPGKARDLPGSKPNDAAGILGRLSPLQLFRNLSRPMRLPKQCSVPNLPPIAELSKMAVSVDCPSPGRIRLIARVGNVPPEAIALARNHKPDLIDYLRPDCRPHHNPSNYIDTPATNRPSWIRTSCRVCGRFIGYRPST